MQAVQMCTLDKRLHILNITYTLPFTRKLWPVHQWAVILQACEYTRCVNIHALQRTSHNTCTHVHVHSNIWALSKVAHIIKLKQLALSMYPGFLVDWKQKWMRLSGSFPGSIVPFPGSIVPFPGTVSAWGQMLGNATPVCWMLPLATHYHTHYHFHPMYTYFRLIKFSNLLC